MERCFLVCTSLLSVQMVVAGPHTRLVFSVPHPLGDIRVPVMEAVILTIKNLIDHVTLGVCQVATVSLPFAAPAHAVLARELFACEMRTAATGPALR